MANTTDIIITCFIDEEEAIETLTDKTGITLNKITGTEKCAGPKTVCFESYAGCHRSLGDENIKQFISEFTKTEFSSPELVCLVIDDDDGNFSGVVTLK